MRIITGFASLTLLIAFSLACKNLSGNGPGSAAKTYASQTDNFTVAFPAGAKDPAAVPDAVLGDDKTTYTTTNGDGIYQIIALKWDLDQSTSEPMKEKLIGAGVDFPLDDQTKNTTFQGVPAAESTGWQWSDNPGPGGDLVKLYERMIAFQPNESKKVYVVMMKSDNKEKLSTKEANDYFSSFKVGAGS